MDLSSLCSLKDVLYDHFVPMLTPQDMAALSRTSATNSDLIVGDDRVWHVLCDRDYHGESLTAPSLPTVQGRETQTVQAESWYQAYKKWLIFDRYVCGCVTAEDFLCSIDSWTRLKVVLHREGLQGMINTFEGTPPHSFFRVWAQNKHRCHPSVMALYAVHGGQSRDLHRGQTALFGFIELYHTVFSMGLLPHHEIYQLAHRLDASTHSTRIGFGRCGRHQFYLCVDVDGNVMHQMYDFRVVVGHGGFLQYMREYVSRLESGIYRGVTELMGVSLFPEIGEQVGECVTRGVEVRASARLVQVLAASENEISFAYSIRIKLLEEGSNCQLVGRHWQFMDANGRVHEVRGEAVVGLQPLLKHGGYVDLGPAGDGQYHDGTFVYQSQTGSVAGVRLLEDEVETSGAGVTWTAKFHTGQASAQGTFSFVPGSIEKPEGPLFNVTVARFPLSVPFPFY